MMSANFKSFTNWVGEGTMKEEEKNKIEESSYESA